MSDDRAFLDAIRAAPDDDLPRLVYADYLDERGDPRGQFIRVQCMIERLPKCDPLRDELDCEANELLSRHEHEWMERQALGLMDCRFRRGMLEQATLTLNGWIESAEWISQKWNLRDLTLSGDYGPPSTNIFPSLAQLPGIERLAIDGIEVGDRFLDAIREGPLLPRLRAIALSEVGVSWAAVGRLTRWKIEALLLAGRSEISFEDVREITGPDSTITRMQLRGWVYHQGVFSTLGMPFNRRRWRSLSVEGTLRNTQHTNPGQSWLEGDPWSHLENLTLDWLAPTATSVEPFHFPVLRELTFSADCAAAAWIRQFFGKHAPQLETLRWQKIWTEGHAASHAVTMADPAPLNMPIHSLRWPVAAMVTNGLLPRSSTEILQLDLNTDTWVDGDTQVIWDLLINDPSSATVELLQMFELPTEQQCHQIEKKIYFPD